MPVINNQILIDLQLNGLMFQTNTFHEWVNYMPNYHERTPRNNLIVKTGNHITLKMKFNEIGIDYTP